MTEANFKRTHIFSKYLVCMCEHLLLVIPVSAGGIHLSHSGAPVVKMPMTDQQRIKPGVTVSDMQERQRNSDQNFQSEFAREMASDVNTSDSGFKSHFAMEMQNSLVIIDDQDNSYNDTAEDDPKNIVNDPHSDNYSYLEADQIQFPQVN